jgi:predicted PurR-regulated permease PerM
MRNREHPPQSQPQAGSGGVSQDKVDAELSPRETARSVTEVRPAWLDQFVWSVLRKVVVVALASALMLLLAKELRHLLWLLLVSSFFAIAMIPGVEHIQTRWKWRRGAAVGVIYVSVVVLSALMVSVLLPSLGAFANQVRAEGGGWIDQLNDLSSEWLGKDLISTTASDETAVVTQTSLRGWSEDVLGLASSGVGVVADLVVVAMFAFYFAADYPRIERGLLSRMRPERQRVYAWVSETSIRQTGAYFYSRLLLTLTNAVLSFCVMLLLGLAPESALPMAVFMGFASQFIPAIGTYVGAAVPALTVLAIQGPGHALILLAWVLVYQSVENTVLSPRLSAKTMEVPGAVAFGAAVAGGALAGPLGAFMALPFAALITAVLNNSGKRYDVVYRSTHGDVAPEEATRDPT